MNDNAKNILLSKYNITILELIGEGGQGVVYKVQKDDGVHPPQTLALKMLKDTGDLTRFMAEYDFGSTHGHDNIIKTYELIKIEGQTGYTMQFLKGQTAIDKMLNGWTWEQFLTVLLPIAKTLDTLHQDGKIHRDIKPLNIMLSKDDKAYLIDFGLHKDFDNSITQSQELFGTPSFIAHEAFNAKNALPESDQYSFAMTVFLLFFHEYPWGKLKSFDETLSIILNGYDHLILESSKVPKELKPIFIKALHPDFSKRYPSCFDFLQAINTSKPSPFLRYLRGLSLWKLVFGS